MILSLFCSLDKCKISLLKIFHPKLLTKFDLKILFVFKISLLISYQYNMWTQTVLAVCLFFILYYLIANPTDKEIFILSDLYDHIGK